MNWIRLDRRLAIYARDGHACVYCAAEPPAAILTLDHWHTVADGGGHESSNLLTACHACNSQRKGEDFGAFLRWLRNRGIRTGGLLVRVDRQRAAPIDRDEGKRLAIERHGPDSVRLHFTDAGRARCNARRRAA
jgi:hypothetical protein